MRLLAVLLLGLVLWLIPAACQAATTCKVTFRENGGGKGVDNCMTKLTTTVRKGKKVTLPELPEKEGYVSLGWTGIKKGDTIEYKVGAKVEITKNTTFYAVRKKLKTCTVTFNNNKGTNSGPPYKELRQVVRKNTEITLPEVPEATGYIAVGWTTKKGATSPAYLPGSQMTIKKDTTFYAVRRKISYKRVLFRDQNGESDMQYDALEMEVLSGATITLPEVMPAKGYTFLGWSTSMGKKTSPDFLAGTTMPVDDNLTLYACMFPWSAEEDPAQLSYGWQQNFRKLIFVGDSRMNRMEKTLKFVYGLSPNLVNVEFVCSEGKGLTWLKQEGIEELGQKLTYGVKPAAVIFNLGVNDLWNDAKYVKYLKSIADDLKPKNVRLYFMSVNPVNHPTLVDSGRLDNALYRTAKRVMEFNRTLREKLCAGEDYTYLDLYNYLIRTGFRFDSGGKDGIENGTDDGLHYGSRTYKRIFNQTISLLLAAP